MVYLLKGKLTRSLAGLHHGDHLALWGPLGNSFSDAPAEHLIMVAGGIGQTPFLCLAREATGRQRFGERRHGYARRVSLCYGARTSRYLADVEAFEKAGAEIQIATEDGSIGPPQRVTEPLVKLLEAEAHLAGTRIACCGPEPMMAAVTRIANRFGAECQVSLETPMACGIGICFSCGQDWPVRRWDYRRTCVEGPVFDGSRIVWD